jgi:outer membrane protein
MCPRSFVTLLLSVSLLSQPARAQGLLPEAAGPAPAAVQQKLASGKPDYTKGAVWWPHFINVYRRPYVAEVNLSESTRMERLLKDGNIYLSLEDAIALALENNLDISVERYLPLLADTDILRARAGGTLRATGTGTSLLSTSSAISDQALVVPGVSFPGPALPPLDPILSGGVTWQHISSPLSNTVTTGTNTLINEGNVNNVTYQQAFLTGSVVTLSLQNSTQNLNSIRNLFNPSLNSSLSLNFTQPLTQGFGRALNARNIRIARNNREVSDLAFKQQVIQTVSAVENLYWDLVSFIENVRVAQEALQTSQKLYNDNKRQVEIGTLAPIEIVRAEAEVATGQQNLTIAQTQVLQQETTLKNALTKNGVASPAIAEAHIIPTTKVSVPPVEAVEPIQDLMSMALQSRPELAQSRIGLTNSDIVLKAARNAMLPTVNLVGNLTNNALAGEVNPHFIALGGSVVTVPSSLFLGGFGTALSQIFDRKFPSYSVGVNLNVPIRNRAAQADMISAQLQYRQQEIRLRQAENAVRVEVKNAVIGLQQARARLDAATKARILQEQTVDAEQKKYALGASTIYNVILTERDLTSARSTEVTAMNNYIKARVELDRATGQTLSRHNISLDEAYEGRVSKPPDPIPAGGPPAAKP